MSVQVLINGTEDTLTTGTRYLAITGGCKWATNRGTWPRTLFSSPGTISYLYARLSDAPGEGVTRTFTIYKNGIATSLTVSISGSDTEAQDTVHSVTVAAGDYLQLRCSDAGGVPVASHLYYAMKWTPTTSGYTQMSGVIEATNLGGGFAFPSFAGSQNMTPAVIPASRIPFPCGGTLRNLYIELSVAPGGTYSRTFKVCKNGAATALSVTISGAATTGNNVADTASVSAGDLIYVTASRSVRGGAATLAALGVAFIPDNVDDFVIANSSGDYLPVTGDGIYHGQPSCGERIDGYSRQLIGWHTRITRFQVEAEPPTTGEWEFQLIDPDVDPLYQLILDSGSSGSEYLVGNETWPDGSCLNLNIIQSGVPNSAPDNHIHGTMSMLATVLPASAGPLVNRQARCMGLVGGALVR